MSTFSNCFPPAFSFFFFFFLSTNKFCLLVNFFSSFSPVKIMSIYLKTGKSKTKKEERIALWYVCMSNYKELQ